MDEKDNKEIASLESKLNGRMAGTGAKVSHMTQVAPGQYQMYVHLDPNSPKTQLFGASRDKIMGLVRERKVDPNSLLGKYATNRKKTALASELQNAGYKDILKAIQSGKDVEKTIKQVHAFNKEISTLDTRFRDVLRPSVIDNRKGTGDTMEAMELYERTELEYKRTGIYGTYLDLLSNFAATGFHNEHADEDVKQYFDAWTQDTEFLNTIVKVFHNLFKYSVVYVLPASGKYEPHEDGVSSIPGQAPSGGTERAKIMYAFEKFFKEQGQNLDRNRLGSMVDSLFEAAAQSGAPVAYTILDPKTVELESSVFGGRTITVTEEGLSSIREALDRSSEGKLSKQEKDKLKLLPSKVRAAALAEEEYVDIDGLIETIFIRKNDFETFALPKGTRVFDSLDYKEELRKADFATLDGIFNYILKVTVGDKDNPVTDIDTLDSLAEAFNTPQKSMAVVWNHTLDIEKISTDDIGAILGNKKYEPVDNDITAALGMTRALIDGSNISASAGVLSAKALQSEINAARKVVETWIYKQYKRLAQDAGFDSYPVVRWKQTVITTDGDAVTRASWMQLADRQLSSRETAQLALGLDPEAETEKLRKQRDLMMNEGIGIMGSPFQNPGIVTPAPDEGRPPSQPTGPKTPDGTDTDTTRESTPDSPSQQTQERSSRFTAEELLTFMERAPEEEKSKLIEHLLPEKYKNAYELQNLLIKKTLIQESKKDEEDDS